MATAIWRRRMARMALMVGVACMAPAAGHAGDAPARLSLTDVANAFEDAALRVNTLPATELARWTGPIYLAISDAPGMGNVAADVEASVRGLAAIARVPVMRVNGRDPRANFVVRPNAGAVAGRSPCRSSVDWTEDGRMLRAEIHLNLANPDRIQRCINHEAMHGFGFRAHAHAALSVLSYTYADQAQLTATDRIMLETLYDPRLRPGMATAAAAVVACHIIAEKLAAPAVQVATACLDRAPAPKRALAALGRPQPSGDAPKTPSLQPGYRDGGM